MEDSKKGTIPMRDDVVLSKTQSPITPNKIDYMKTVLYDSTVGSIMYAMTCTRPDVACVVSMTNRHQRNPSETHWVVVKNILRISECTMLHRC